MWYPHHDLSWEGTIFMLLTMIVFWGGLITLGVWFLRAYIGPNANNSRHYAGDERQFGASRDALDILKERYARGEISKTEFEQIRDDLRG
jgi:putative membrane protein